MANVTFATVPMDDYLYCRLCRCDVGKANDGPRLHAEQRHPGAAVEPLYAPSAPRSVIAGEADEPFTRRCACSGCTFHHTEEMFGPDSLCLYCALAHRGGPYQGEAVPPSDRVSRPVEHVSGQPTA